TGRTQARARREGYGRRERRTIRAERNTRPRRRSRWHWRGLSRSHGVPIQRPRREPVNVDWPADLAEAVPAAARGDECAFRALYRAVQPGLLRYLRGMVGEDAEEVASQTWLQIARDIGNYRGE